MSYATFIYYFDTPQSLIEYYKKHNKNHFLKLEAFSMMNLKDNEKYIQFRTMFTHGDKQQSQCFSKYDN